MVGSGGRGTVAGAAVLLAAALAVTGCGATGGGESTSAVDRGVAAPEAADREAGSVREDAAAERNAGQDTAGERGEDGAGSQEASADELPDPAATHIVRTASLTVTVEDVPGTLAEVRTAVESAGGYVADESTDRDAEGHDRSRVTLRVPPREYDDLLEELSGLGELVERKVSAKDVTDQVVDVESRIETQKASVARVRELMDEAVALSDVVSLESELSDRQADLEALQARLKSLRERTGMATVTLSLHEPDGEPVAERKEDDPSFGDALAAGWDAFVTMLRWLAVVLGASLPFVAAGLLVALVWRLVRPRLPRRSSGAHGVTSPLPVAAPPETDGDDADDADDSDGSDGGGNDSGSGGGERAGKR
ncbi:DUF4349 domain-containing protein [Streptomyces sp. TRM43335]|uniref:DUF4349 domain-containing protein n=2 Tax=Streptomyces taklimakanensis TaxID=2569853 RepID=A0A6G2BGS7_9ACTN|nr:DUF4349 domain-containing protein [Streptomyces taklimakanensis]MTE21487.1 DUF4349 domain-containing protein [Streptomyces taklimakanensis]